MDIQSIHDIPDDILSSFDKLLTEDCQPGKYSLNKIREISKTMDMLYLLEEGKPVYFLLLDLFPKHKMVYIHDVCVSKTHRGKSLFKKSLIFLKEYYLSRGYTTFTLDASNSTKEEGLNQRARLYIFHSAGFHLNTRTGYFTQSGDYKIINTQVLLDNKEIVEIQKRRGEKYYVKNKRGAKYSVNINEINKCLDGELNEISCPMIMSLKNNTTRKKLRK
jgi:hypothetical protein